MSRVSLFLFLSATLAVPLATGCGKNDEDTTHPDEAAESEIDPLDELTTIPDQIQAEVDVVLQPLTDVDVVIDQVTSMPQTLGIDAASLRGLAAASLTSDGGVSVELDIEADAKAEVEEVLAKVQGIATGLRETPQRVKTATGNIAVLGTRATGLVTRLTASFQAKLGNPLLEAEKKAQLQADLDLVLKLDADIKATVTDAKQTVTSLPSKGKEALVKLTTAFAGGASAEAS